MGIDCLTDEKTTTQGSLVSEQTLGPEEAASLVAERSKELVNELIEQRGHGRPPFLPAEYARLVGIRRIEKANLGDVSAILIRSRDGHVIRVNRNHNWARQNFSCAHEIGHVLLARLRIEPSIDDLEFRTFNPQARQIARAKAKERLCDAAATELLMPEAVFSERLSSLGICIKSLERLAHMFRVSLSSAALRVVEVSTEPCIALLWRPRPRIKPNSLQLAWCVGPRAGFHNRGKYVPKHAFAKRSSALYRAYQYGCDDSVRSYKLFGRGADTKRISIESKGFGTGEMRYVISLALAPHETRETATIELCR